MKAITVNFNLIGFNCWSAERFLDRCHSCDRYDRCNYPERVANDEYDTVRAAAAAAKNESDRLYTLAREMKVK